MAQTYVGIDVGNVSVKLVERAGAQLRAEVKRLPENMVESDKVIAPETLAAFIRTMRREGGFKAKNAALVLPDSAVLFRHVTLPMMTTSELELNLPYEFRDFISDDPDAYYYDYIVDTHETDAHNHEAQASADETAAVTDDSIDEKGQSETPDFSAPAASQTLSLYAAAVRKDIIDAYAGIMRKAGLKLKLAIPSQMALTRLLRHHIVQVPADSHCETAFVNLGFDNMVITVFHGSAYRSSRVVDMGCREIDRAIADMKGIDPFTASSYKNSNYEGVLDSDACREIYDQLALEVNKVVNFHNFNNPEEEIERAVIFGGGAAIPQLYEAIATAVAVPQASVAELLPADAAQIEGIEASALALSCMLDAEEVL